MYPLMAAALERFKLRNTYFGNLGGRFEGSAGPLFVRGLLLWVVLILPFVAGLIIGAAAIDWEALMAAIEIGGNAIGNLDSNTLAGIAALVATPFWLFIVGPVLYPAFQALIWRWWVSGLRFGDVSVSTRLRTGQVYRIYLRFLGYSFVFSLVASIMLSFLFAIAAGIGALLAKTTGAPADEIGTILAGIVGIASYVVMMLGYSTIYQAVVRLGLWRSIWESLDISNISQLDHVSAAGIPSSAVGEGLADALNMGGL
jgi:uncharacterized membrane protein YjgN (DUF898 family)